MALLVLNNLQPRQETLINQKKYLTNQKQNLTNQKQYLSNQTLAAFASSAEQDLQYDSLCLTQSTFFPEENN